MRRNKIMDQDRSKKLETQLNIEKRVKKLERENYLNKKLSPEDMVKKIRKIVEEEVGK